VFFVGDCLFLTMQVNVRLYSARDHEGIRKEATSRLGEVVTHGMKIDSGSKTLSPFVRRQ
jgi:hypothetical protein